MYDSSILSKRFKKEKASLFPISGFMENQNTKRLKKYLRAACWFVYSLLWFCKRDYRREEIIISRFEAIWSLQRFRLFGINALVRCPVSMPKRLRRSSPLFQLIFNLVCAPYSCLQWNIGASMQINKYTAALGLSALS